MPEGENFLAQIYAVGTNFFKQILLKNKAIYQNISFDSLIPNSTYDFVLSSFPYLKAKEILTIKQGQNPSGSALDFGVLKTGA